MNKNTQPLGTIQFDFSNAENIIPSLLKICESLSTADVQPIYAELKSIDTENTSFEDVQVILARMSEKLKGMKQPTSGRQLLVEDFVNLTEKHLQANLKKIEASKNEEAKLAKQKSDEAASKKKKEDEAKAELEKAELEKAELAKAELAKKESEKSNIKEDEETSTDKTKEGNEGSDESSKEEEINKNESGSEAEKPQTEEKSDENSDEAGSVTTGASIGVKTKLTKTSIKKIDPFLVKEHDLKVGDYIFLDEDKITAFQKGTEEIVTIA